MNQVVPMQKPSLIAVMASEYSMDPDKFASTIKSTCMPPNSTNEDFAAFLMVAQKHNLNPVTREIFAFPKKGGGIQPIVSIDGWMTLINSHPQFDGMEFEDEMDKAGNMSAITCRMYRKDRNRPVAAKEYMAECKRPTEPWQKWPARMLRHKAAIQAARYAFSFSGIIDPEEAERSPDVITGDVVAPPPPTRRIESVQHEEAAESPADLLAKAEEWLERCDDQVALDEAYDKFKSLHAEDLSEDDMQTVDTLYVDCEKKLAKA